MHVLRLVSLAVVAGLAVLGCSAPGTGTQPPSDVAVPGELEKFYRQAVRWESCAGYGTDGRYLALNGVECARITVPLDYDDPDGQTVSLGGLIREDVQKVEDKVPLLGDIPLAGRLFRTNVDQKIKRNLIIFVTARLMDAEGKPVRQDEDQEEIVEPLGLQEIPPPTFESATYGK
jgi:hypothetical protein